MTQTCSTTDPNNSLQAVIAHAKEYGFLYPSSEIYEGLQAVYDYGPFGAALKRNLQNLWWQSMTQLHSNIVGIDAAIFMHPRAWQASGHVDSFSDPMIDNKDIFILWTGGFSLRLTLKITYNTSSPVLSLATVAELIPSHLEN